MAKISPVSIKYMVIADFEAEGAVEKPDVIGALFGQTEGLLGSDLEMRELQKEGKIGRIEVNLELEGGKTKGKIEIPSALDKSETSLIAAAIETIDRIGPTEAKIEVEKIEDVRGNKREYIIERAKKLMSKIEGATDSREISNNLMLSARQSKIQEYGEEKLPAGDLDKSEIIVVEGRADVLNLLRNNVDNVIGMNGTHLPDTIIELSKDKRLTLFLDGDRGGKLIAKNAIDNAKISFVAFAPDGKEVEELTGKEILASLRKKIPVSEFSASNNVRDRSRNSQIRGKRSSRPERERYSEIQLETQDIEVKEEDLRDYFDEIQDTKSAYLLDSNLAVLRKISKSNLVSTLSKFRKPVSVIILDGLATMPMIRAAEKSRCKYFYAKNFASVDSANLKLLGF